MLKRLPLSAPTLDSVVLSCPCANSVVALGGARCDGANEQLLKGLATGHIRADQSEELGPRRELQGALGHVLQRGTLLASRPSEAPLVAGEDVVRSGGARRPPHQVKEQDLEGNKAEARQ